VTKLLEIMQQNGISQIQLASQLRWWPSRLNLYTKGYFEPSNRGKEQIAAVLGVTVNDILGSAEKKGGRGNQK
jgi:transcriptional regulator with XRE-family HTH domain